jgi:hypothetical protein
VLRFADCDEGPEDGRRLEVARIGAVDSERVIRARLARQRREGHRRCAATDDNAARRDAGTREPAGTYPRDL